MFRVKFTRVDGVWWTAPLDWVDANRFIRTLRLQGLGADAFAATKRLGAELRFMAVEGAFAATRTGQPHVGQVNITCECGQCPPLQIGTIRVPDRRPQVSQAEPGDEQTPRELRGPTADDLAAHPPAAASQRPRQREGKDGGVCDD
jgi:hypothetical protein